MMETMMRSDSLPIRGETANYDEVSMHQSLLFSDSLKDLKNLRKQLYAAAEYFESSYSKDDQKQMVVDTLRDYAIKALVNTVDHLGSVTYKVNDIVDEKVDEVSGTERRVSCIKQRLRTCQEYINREGLSQQSLVINTPKYHKRYILPGGEAMNGSVHTKSKYQGCSLDDEDNWHQFQNAVRATIVETPSPPVRKGPSPSPSPRPLQRAATFIFSSSNTKKEQDKRTGSPYRFPLRRSGSVSSGPSRTSSRSTTPTSRRPATESPRAITPNPSRPITSNAFVGRQQFPFEPRKSASMRLGPERGKESPKESEQYPSKSKRLLKALLTRRKSKKDEMLYTYLDEY